MTLRSYRSPCLIENNTMKALFTLFHLLLTVVLTPCWAKRSDLVLAGIPPFVALLPKNIFNVNANVHGEHLIFPQLNEKKYEEELGISIVKIPIDSITLITHL